MVLLHRWDILLILRESSRAIDPLKTRQTVASGSTCWGPPSLGRGGAPLLCFTLRWDSHPRAFPRNRKPPYLTPGHGWANFCESEVYQLISSSSSLRLLLQG